MIYRFGSKSTEIIGSDVFNFCDTLQNEESKKVKEDLMIYGKAFILDGKAIDPHDIYIDVPTVEEE